MAIGEIIKCTSAEDLFRRAEDLQQKGIKTEFVARNTMKVVEINKQQKLLRTNGKPLVLFLLVFNCDNCVCLYTLQYQFF